MPLIRGADNVVKLEGPVKESDGTALDSTNASATASFFLYGEQIGRAHV